MFLEVTFVLLLIYILRLFFLPTTGDLEKAGIPCASNIPLIGSLWRSALRRKNLPEDVIKIYKETGDERCRYIALYNFGHPIILLKDLDLIKKVTVKDFDHFTDHRTFIGNNENDLFSQNLLSLKGQKWRDMRATLSPAFTSLKIKNMLPFISECGTQMTDYMKEVSKDDKYVEVELKDLTSRYMNDVIYSTAFGLKVNSFVDKDNDFFRIGKNITSFKFMRFIKIIISARMPRLAKLFGLTFLEKRDNDFFTNLVLNAMEQRQEKNIVRQDMIHLLMEAKKGSLKHESHVIDKDAGFATVEESAIGNNELKPVWTNNDLVAQAVLFFFAGFESTSNTISFILYELAANPEIQRKLQKEIDETLNGSAMSLSYEILQKMKYIDMVVSEGLRKWPGGPNTDRLCIKDYNLGPIREEEESPTFTVKTNMSIWITIVGIHRDSKYWTNPEKFDPERFSDVNKHKINPMAYIPFGSGPRNCIGSRFALVELKICLIHLLSQFDIEPGPKSVIPLELAQNDFNFKPKDGFWFNIKQRNSN